MKESEDEYILLESYNAELNKIVILDNDDYSIWAFVMDSETQEIEFDGYVASLDKPFESEEEVEKLLEDGFAPAITTEYASKDCQIENVLKKEFSAVWHDSGFVEIQIDGVTQVLMDLEEEISYSKAIEKDGPYGMKLDDNVLSELIFEEE